MDEPERPPETEGFETTLDAGPWPAAPERIGPYRLRQRIGEGGFGAVYVAEQEEPIRRRVAVKLLKPGMGSREVVARFEQERQALALMDHPHIAKVLDAGATPDGRPFFVMELVGGEPITEYCDRHRLSIQERLELFVQVCQAVQHAHHKGVIHRDIKPANVLASPGDDAPQVKVIDFGIAKAVAAKLTADTVFTQHHQLIGTPAYMSPEQATGSLDIDTRADVYSLGVLLYELLTGTTPITSEELRRAGFSEVMRLLQDYEPPKPSSRITQSGPALADTAAHRRSDARRLPQAVRGDLDWIVMKAIDKDRQRRYETANGLAMDVQRYLAGEPVVAAPPSAAYRLRKLVRRHTAAVVTVLLVAVSLLLGLAGTGLGLVRASRERAVALAAQQREASARQSADAMNGFLREVLVSSDPSQGGRQQMLVSDAMAQALDRLDAGAFADRPEIELELRTAIADILSSNGRGPEAVAAAEKAVALARRLGGDTGDHPGLPSALVAAARAQNAIGRPDLSEPLAREGLELERRLHPEGSLGEGRLLKAVAGALANQRRHGEAEPYFREALEVRRRLHAEDHADLAQSLNDYGYVLMELGRPGAAETLFGEAQAMRRRLFSGDHPAMAESLNNLAWSLERSLRLPEAESNYRLALEMYQRLFAGDHALVSRGLYNLGWHLMLQGRYGEAEPVVLGATGMAERLYPNGAPPTVERLTLVAICQLMTDREAQAEKTFADAQRLYERLEGPRAATPASLAGGTLGERQLAVDPQRAQALALALERRARRAWPAGSAGRAAELAASGSVLAALATPEAIAVAEIGLREASAIWELAPPSPFDHALLASDLGGVLVRRVELHGGSLDDLAAAESLLEAAMAGLEEPHARIPAWLVRELRARAAERLARLHEGRNLLAPDPAAVARAAHFTQRAQELRASWE